MSMASSSAPGSALSISSCPSSSSPSMASQVLASASSPSCLSACATRFSWPRVWARWLRNAAFSCRPDAFSCICGSASISCCSALSKSFSSSTRCSRSDATDAIFEPPAGCCILCAMTRSRMALTLALAVIGGLAFPAPTAAPQTPYRFQQVVPGIYSAIGTGTMNVGSNSAVIVNADDVVIVDSHISPASGRAMLQELRSITDKPVRFLVNTHFHYDHVNGNQAFAPAADIIGHDYTRRKLSGDVLQSGMFADVLRGLPRQLDDLQARATKEVDAAAKARLEQQLRVQTAYAESLKDLKL